MLGLAFYTKYGSAALKDSVSAHNDFVIVGADAGSKAKKAAELGVKTLTESEFLEMIR